MIKQTSSVESCEETIAQLIENQELTMELEEKIATWIEEREGKLHDVE